LALSNKEKNNRKSKVTEIRSQFNFLRDGILEAINAPPPNNSVKGKYERRTC